MDSQAYERLTAGEGHTRRRPDRLEALVLVIAVVVAASVPLVAFLVVHGPGNRQIQTVSNTTVVTLRPPLTLAPVTDSGGRSSTATPAHTNTPPASTSTKSHHKARLPAGTSPCLVFAFALSDRLQITPPPITTPTTTTTTTT
jgi:hypothetical protein